MVKNGGQPATTTTTTNGTTDFHPFGLLPWREEEYNVRNRKQNKIKKK
jgi:hypothetical protein